LSRVGLHVRIHASVTDVLEKASRLQLPFFQCFLIKHGCNQLITVTNYELQLLASLRSQYNQLYFHGSYYINLASVKGNNGYRRLKKELNLAKRLGFSHMILHPGTACGATTKIEGIYALARALNTILQHENDVRIVLENTAHGNLSIGSDINDFRVLLCELNYPEKISFCIDTAHAHSFGYDIVDKQKQTLFIKFLETTVGLDAIALIHLNDTQEKIGSCIDRHARFGQGGIGVQALQHFVTHPALAQVPIILELPIMDEKYEQAILQKIKHW